MAKKTTKAYLSAQLAAAQAEIARLRAQDRSPVRQPSDVERALRAHAGDVGALEEEHFWAVLLDARQRPLRVLTVHKGSLSQVDVHPRELFREAVRMAAHSIVLAHNHPSGDCQPSDADIQLTNRMVDAGRLLGIPVLDHLVVTAREACSLASLGLV